MKTLFRTVSVLLMTCCAVCPALGSDGTSVTLREDFSNLDDWRPLHFPKIPKHTKYTITTEGDNGILTAESHASASGLLHKKTFNPLRYPVLRWRWKVDSIYGGVDSRKKDGDDYPLRIYVLFEYDPAKAGWALRAKYGLTKKMYGEYPPLGTLNYVWSSRRLRESYFDSPYTKRSKMIPVRSGTRRIGEWLEEEVDILADYRRLFGEDPPPRASLAVMNDSDNTGLSSVSHLDFIEVGDEFSTGSARTRRKKSRP